MNKIIFLTMMLAMSAQARANEVDDYCNLIRTEAGAKSATLGWPKLFASVGEATSSNPSFYGGISESLSGLIKSSYLQDIGQSQCRLYSVNKTLNDNVLNLDNKIFLMQVEAQRPILAEALKLAEENVDFEKRLFETQNSTVIELSSAYKIRDEIKSQLVTTEQKYSRLREIPAVETDLNLRQKAAESMAAQAQVATLSSAIDTLSGWDLVASVGVKKDFTLGTTAGFGALNLTFSFGSVSSAIKSSRVSQLTRNYTDAHYDSPQNAYLRLVRSEKEILLSEQSNLSSIKDQFDSIQELLKKVGTVDSVRAKRVQRNLTIQQLTQKAALEASTIKIQTLETWLSANAE